MVGWSEDPSHKRWFGSDEKLILVYPAFILTVFENIGVLMIWNSLNLNLVI